MSILRIFPGRRAMLLVLNNFLGRSPVPGVHALGLSRKTVIPRKFCNSDRGDMEQASLSWAPAPSLVLRNCRSLPGFNPQANKSDDHIVITFEL